MIKKALIALLTIATIALFVLFITDIYSSPNIKGQNNSAAAASANALKFTETQMEWLISTFNFDSAQIETLRNASNDITASRYPFTVNYSLPQLEMFESINVNPAGEVYTGDFSERIAPDVILGLYSGTETASGTATLNAKYVLINSISADTSKNACDTLIAKLKERGLRPLTLSEFVAFHNRYPSLNGQALGSMVKMTSNYTTYGSGYSKIATGAGNYLVPNISSNKITSVQAVCKDTSGTQKIAVVEDSGYSGAIKTASSLPSSGLAQYLNPKEYSVSVNYDNKSFGSVSSYKNNYNGSGTKTVKIQLVQFLGTTGKTVTQSAAKKIAESYPGYRPATGAELYSLITQYPETTKYFMMAFGTYNNKCQASPWSHWNTGPLGPNGTKYDDRALAITPGGSKNTYGGGTLSEGLASGSLTSDLWSTQWKIPLVKVE